MELCGIHADVHAQLFKLASIGLCSNLDGQIMVELMVHPPAPGGPSAERFERETQGILSGLRQKSQQAVAALNALGVEQDLLRIGLDAHLGEEHAAAILEARRAVAAQTGSGESALIDPFDPGRVNGQTSFAHTMFSPMLVMVTLSSLSTR